MTSFVYALKDPRTDAIRYVGITNQKLKDRLYQHTKENNRNHRCNWIKSILNIGLSPEIEMLATVDDSLRVEAEKGWIAFFRKIGADLVNATDGGEGLLNPSKETRIKLSRAQMGNKKFLGHRHSPDTKARMSKSQMGNTHAIGNKNRLGVKKFTRV